MSLDIRKALDTSVGTTGSVLVPEVISEGIRMFVETRSPLWNILNRFDFDGYAFTYREQNGLPVASFGAELGALPPAQNATYAMRTVPIKSIYIRGELSGQLIEASKSLEPALEREINNSAMGMVRTLEQKIISGNSSVDPNEFDGLDRQITNTLDVARDLTNDATVNPTDQPLTMVMLEELLDLPAGGRPTHLIMNAAMRRRLWSVLQTQVRYVDGSATIEGGFTVPTYAGLPIIEIFDNAALFADRILAPDMTMVSAPVLKPFTYEELAKTRDSVDYFIKTYMAIVVEGAARHHAKMINVSSTIA